MSSDLKDYLYLEAKEKAFEIEIEARKQFEKKKIGLIKERMTHIDEKYERQDTVRETEYKQWVNKSEVQTHKCHEN